MDLWRKANCIEFQIRSADVKLLSQAYILPNVSKREKSIQREGKNLRKKIERILNDNGFISGFFKRHLCACTHTSALILSARSNVWNDYEDQEQIKSIKSRKNTVHKHTHGRKKNSEKYIKKQVNRIQ